MCWAKGKGIILRIYSGAKSRDTGMSMVYEINIKLDSDGAKWEEVDKSFMRCCCVSYHVYRIC